MPVNTAYNMGGSGGQQPSMSGGQPSGSQLRRRYMPNTAMGGAAGPAPSGMSKAPGPSTGTFGGQHGQQPSPSSPLVPPSYDFGNKGGGVLNMPNAGTARALPPGVRSQPSSPMYGGFNPSQMTQQNGQWGMTGRGGNFQALGGNALQRWLAQQPQTQPTTPPVLTPPSSPSPGGYVTPQQWNDWTNSGANNWFTQGEGAAGHPTDYNAFNQWFQNFGQQFDPSAWARLYGQQPQLTPSQQPPSNVGSSGGTYWTT